MLNLLENIAFLIACGLVGWLAYDTYLLWKAYADARDKLKNDPDRARCHCGKLTTKTPFNQYMDDYCNDCTWARCDINAASDCPTLYKNKRR